jgi:hypothetical protein
MPSTTVIAASAVSGALARRTKRATRDTALGLQVGGDDGRSERDVVLLVGAREVREQLARRSHPAVEAEVPRLRRQLEEGALEGLAILREDGPENDLRAVAEDPPDAPGRVAVERGPIGFRGRNVRSHERAILALERASILNAGG